MDIEKFFEVMRICIPVFALIAVGKWLQRRGTMKPFHQRFLNNLAYYLALPSLIFAELSVQRFENLIDPAIIISVIGATLCMIAIVSFLVVVFRVKGTIGASLTYGTFWANVTYMGFPLAAGAFGEHQGLALAAIVNAFAMPTFVSSGFILIGLYTRKDSKDLLKSIFQAFLNPVVIAALGGLLTAYIISSFHLNDGSREVPLIVVETAKAFRALLKLTGGMGLPVALLSIGGSLSLSSLSKQIVPLSFTAAAKLIITPLLTLILIKTLFPHTSHAATGVAVLLMSTPTAVACYVVSCKFGIQEQFVSSLLAFTTLLSMITIPVWLYFIL